MPVETKPCLCCKDGTCCKIDGVANVNFTPAEGYWLNYLEGHNLNPNKCSGRAKVFIEVAKWADPALVCGSTCTGSGQPCTFIPESVKSEIVNQVLYRGSGIWGYEISNSTNIVTAIVGGSQNPPADLTNCAFQILVADNSSEETCYYTTIGGPTQSQVRLGLFKNSNEITATPPCNLVGWSGNTLNTWLVTNYTSPFRNWLDADFRGNNLIIPTHVGGTYCEYYVYGISTTSGGIPRACYDSHYNFDWWIDKVHWHTLNQIYALCAVKCGANPCPISNYSWPLTINCTPDDYYKIPTSDASNTCVLYLDETVPAFYNNGKCTYRASYVGALEAGVVDCNETPNDIDCKCCGEP